MNTLKGYKTYIVGTILIIVGAYLTTIGNQDTGMVLIGLGATSMGLRNSIKD